MLRLQSGEQATLALFLFALRALTWTWPDLSLGSLKLASLYSDLLSGKFTLAALRDRAGQQQSGGGGTHRIVGVSS